MDSTIVKKSLNLLLKFIPVELAPMGWYFSENQPEEAITIGYNKRSCMFNYRFYFRNSKFKVQKSKGRIIFVF